MRTNARRMPVPISTKWIRSICCSLASRGCVWMPRSFATPRCPRAGCCREGLAARASVRRSQTGIYAFTQNRKGWKTSTGEQRYRRGMYTFFYRSAPYPLFGTFDAPDFQTTCTRRARSNTPLQALTIANDTAFFEFAQGLAARVIEEIPGAALERRSARIQRAFELAMCRPGTALELQILGRYAWDVAAEFQAAGEGESKALLDEKLKAAEIAPHEAAVLVAVARAILNTDNFITRE